MAKGCVTVMRRLWVRLSLGGINDYLLVFSILSSVSKAKARRWVPPLNTQCLENSSESGERTVLTLGSLCLSCCVQDTAWSWKKVCRGHGGVERRVAVVTMLVGWSLLFYAKTRRWVPPVGISYWMIERCKTNVCTQYLYNFSSLVESIKSIQWLLSICRSIHWVQI